MRRHIRSLIIFAMIGSLSTLYLAGITSHNLAFSCECAGEPKSPGEAFSEAEAVFSGKVTAITIIAGRYEEEKLVSLDVGRAWKGVSNDTVTVVTVDPNASCGFPFEENREYLVYAYVGGERDAPLKADMCGRTAPIEIAQTDLAFLDFPIIVGVGAAIAGVLAFLTLRSRK